MIVAGAVLPRKMVDSKIRRSLLTRDLRNILIAPIEIGKGIVGGIFATLGILYEQITRREETSATCEYVTNGGATVERDFIFCDADCPYGNQGRFTSPDLCSTLEGRRYCITNGKIRE